MALRDIGIAYIPHLDQLADLYDQTEVSYRRV